MLFFPKMKKNKHAIYVIADKNFIIANYTFENVIVFYCLLFVFFMLFCFYYVFLLNDSIPSRITLFFFSFLMSLYIV